MAKITQSKIQGLLSLIAALVPVIASAIKSVKGTKSSTTTKD